MKKYKEDDIAANNAFPVSNVGIFLPRMNRYGATLFTLSTVKVTVMLPR
jgi:hypothetical protein